jgi:hypothetical protein
MKLEEFKKSPERIKLEEAIEQKRIEWQAIRDELSILGDELYQQKDEFWKNNFDNYDLFDVDDLFEVSEGAWDDGRGNNFLSEKLDEWIRSQSPILSRGDWHMNDTLKSNIRPIVGVKIYMDRNATEEDKDRAAEFLGKMHRIVGAYHADYRFQILEHTCSEFGYYTLKAVKHGKKGQYRATVTRTTYGHSDTVFEGTLRESLDYIQKNHYA